MIRLLWIHLWMLVFPLSRINPPRTNEVAFTWSNLVLVVVLAIGLVGCVNNPKYAALSKSPGNTNTSRLQVKPGTVTTQATPTKLRNAASGAKTGEWYSVAKGDTIYSVAMRFDLDYRRLAQANDIGSDFHLAIGQRIKLTDDVIASNKQGSVSTQQNSATVSKVTDTKGVAATQKGTHTPTSVAINDGPIVWQWPLNRNIVKTDASITTQLKGIDISGSIGENIVSAASGVVVFAGSGLRGYGNLVIVQHSGNYLSAYAYASELLVREKQTVAAGDPVAIMGRANVASQPALHFEIRKDGKPLNPLSFLP